MRISNIDIPNDRVHQLIKDIKGRTYLIDDALIMREIAKALYGKRKILETLCADHFDERSRRTAWYKDIVKAVRMHLRRHVGMFEKEGSHLSIEERKPQSERIYEKIFTITGKPKRIIDIACGIHPLSFPAMGLDHKHIIYTAWDVSEECIKRVKAFFAQRNISGSAHLVDVLRLRYEDLFAQIPMQDICFLFKALDSLEPAKGHKFAELLVIKVPTRYVVVSFPTMTITKKPMHHPYRGWMDRMLKRLGYEFRVFVESDEIFYVIRK